MTVRELLTKILIRSDETGLRKVTTSTNAAKRQMRAASRAAWQLKKDLKGIGDGVKVMVAAVAAGRIAKFFTADFAKSTDEAVKFSSAMGISLESYMGLAHAVKIGGATIEDLNKTLTQLPKRALEVAQGNKTQARSFRDLGVNVKDAHGNLKKSDVLLMEIADAFKNTVPESKRAGLAMQLFGRTGAKLVPTLVQGADGIRQLQAEAKRLGVTLTEDQAKVAENYNDEMTRAKAVVIGFRNVIALQLLPAITKNVKAFVDWAREGDNLKNTIARLIQVAKALAVVLAVVAATKVGQTMVTLVGVLKKTAFWMQVNASKSVLMWGKFALIGAVIAGIVLAVQDLWVYSKGGVSVIGPWFEKMGIDGDKLRGVIRSVVGWFKRLGAEIADLASQAFPALIRLMARLEPIGRAWLKMQRALAKALIDLLTLLWKEFGPALTELGEALIELFNEIGPLVADVFQTVLDVTRAVADEMVSLWRTAWPQIQEVGRAAMELIRAGIAEVKKAWKELQPAIDEVKKAMAELWAVSKPIIGKIISGSLRMSKLLMEVGKRALPFLAGEFKRSFKVIAAVINGAIRSLTLVVKAVTAIVSKIRSAYNMFTEITGGPKVELGEQLKGATPQGQAAAVARPAPAGAASVSQSNRVNVGGMTVTIQGTNATPEEIEAATKKAFSDAISDAFTSFQPMFT